MAFLGELPRIGENDLSDVPEIGEKNDTRLRVLLADDHPKVLENAKKLLGPDYLVVGAVSNGVMALEAARELTPDLIVLDLKMPQLSGLDVLRWLMDHPQYRRIPKILLSGSSEDRDIEEAYQLGVNTYFQKPGSLDEYRELIHHMISYWAHTKRPVIRHAAF